MFEKTRIKLTAWYLLIIMLISLSFSLVIYRVQMVEVEKFARDQRNRIEHQLPQANFVPFEPLHVDPDLIAETEKRLLLNMLLINGVIIFVSGGMGYLLAGKTLRPIKEMIEEQDRFISDSSHELRTPLTSLKSAMEVALMDPKLSLKDAKILITENIEDVNRLQKLSDSLIQLTKRNFKQKLNLENLTSRPLFDDAIKQVKSLACKRQIIIKRGMTSVKFAGDKDKLINLLVILLDNAVKYSPFKKTIHTKAWKTKHYVHFSIKDEGVGIAEKDLPHIFDRFYRADSSRTNEGKTSGYGLGLSIAKMIVDQHHGSISVKSNVKNGTIFIVKLPLNQH
jgi:two-component system, OmpR family, sensor histidine kinase CiaH